ncbi:MBL fold metallo-hydrolase [Bacillus sp. T17B1]|uniref:MBL fold metallo-hydrolase n=1 Tax=Bacillus sp. T17B1 TaxID=2918911 RepID=UPI00227F4CEE|nr:MBL fold metallo-hydrolase [Bacillus sp. T17B1]
MLNTYKLTQLKSKTSLFKNYIYIISDKNTKNAAIIDPAWEGEVIYDALDALGVKLTTILLTHSHYDHVNMVNPILEKYSPQVYMSQREIEIYNFRCDNLHPLQDMQYLKLGDTEILCLLTPGHTAGGMCFLLSDHIITGDTVFIEGCGKCNTDGGSAEDMFNSFQKLRNMVPLDVRVCPGHSYGKEAGLTFKEVLEYNLYFQISKKEHFVRFRMRKYQTGLYEFK